VRARCRACVGWVRGRAIGTRAAHLPRLLVRPCVILHLEQLRKRKLRVLALGVPRAQLLGHGGELSLSLAYLILQLLEVLLVRLVQLELHERHRAAERVGDDDMSWRGRWTRNFPRTSKQG